MQRNGMSGCLIGCLVASGLSVIAIIVVALMLAPRAVRSVRGVVTNEQKWSATSQAWRPPGASPENVFPDRVGTAPRGAIDNKPAIPALGLVALGWHTVYTAGNDRIDVHAYRGSPLEGEALLARVRSEVQGGFRSGTRSYFNGPNRFSYHTSPPPDYGTVWTKDGWTFYARSSTTETAEFLRTLLEANSGITGHGVPFDGRTVLRPAPATAI